MVSRVNTRFVVLLSAVLAAIVLGMVGFWFVFVEQDPAELVHRGDELMADHAPAQALGYYGRALQKHPTNLQWMDKYLAALRAAEVDDVSTAQRYVGQMRALMREAAEQQPDNTDRLDQFYALELRLARDDARPEVYDRLYGLADGKLQADPDNLIVQIPRHRTGPPPGHGHR